MALQIRGNTQIMQASVSLDRLDSSGGSIFGAVTIDSFGSSNATITGGTINNSSVTTLAGTITGRLTHSGTTEATKFSSSMVDIDGGTIDGVDLSIDSGKSLSGVGTFTFDSGAVSFANDQLSGDYINGGVIDSVGIEYSDIDINSGKSIEIKSGGSLSVDSGGSADFSSAGSGLSFANDQISGNAIANGSLTDIAVDGSLNLGSLSSMGDLTLGSDMISGNSIHGGNISGDLQLSGDEVSVLTGKFTAGGGSFIVDSSGNATMQNLTVQGTTTTVNAETIELADNFVLLNRNVDSGGVNFNAGIEVARSSSNVKFEWDETNAQWSLGAQKLYSSAKFMASGFEGDLLDNNGSILVDNTNKEYYGSIKDSANGTLHFNHNNGNATSSSKWLTPRVLSFDSTGDIFGSAKSVDGSANVEFKLDVQADSLEFSMINSGSILSATSGSDNVWDSAGDDKLVSAKDIKEYVDNSTESGLAAQALSFKIGTGIAMTNVKYIIEDITVDATEAGSEYVDLSVASESSYETLADVYMNGQKLRHGAGKDFIFTTDGSARKRIQFSNIDLEVGDVIEAKYFVAE